MKEQFVSYDIALKLKEKGFDEECIAYKWDSSYKLESGTVPNSEHLHYTPIGIDNHNRLPSRVSIPLWQQVIDWLDKKEIFCSADMRIEDGLFKWYPVVKTVVDYEEVKVELSPRGTKQNSLIDIIIYALTLI